MIGFDLDGTLVPIFWNTYGIKEEHFNNLKCINYMCENALKMPPLMIPNGNFYIVTNRNKDIFEKVTLEWIKKHNLSVLALSMDDKLWHNDHVSMAISKSKRINDLKLTEYYEDNINVKNLLKSLCPDTEILDPLEAVIRGRAKEIWEIL